MIIILDKSELTQLISHGEIFTSPCNISYKDDELAIAVAEIFKSSNPVELPQEKFVLKINWNWSNRTSFNVVNIFDIEAVYPIERSNLHLYRDMFPILPIEQSPVDLLSIFNEVVPKAYLGRSIINGINLFRTYCGYERLSPSDEMVKAVMRGVLLRTQYKHFDLPSDQRNPWSVLLSYNRYETYPSDIRGFFLDTEEIYIYAEQKDWGYQDGLLDKIPEPTESIHDLKSDKFDDAIDELSCQNDKCRNYITKVGNLYGNIRIPLSFLWIKSQMVKGNDVLPSELLPTLVKIKGCHSIEFESVATLIGGFFGYEKLCKCCLGKQLTSVAPPMPHEPPKDRIKITADDFVLSFKRNVSKDQKVEKKIREMLRSVPLMGDIDRNVANGDAIGFSDIMDEFKVLFGKRVPKNYDQNINKVFNELRSNYNSLFNE